MTDKNINKVAENIKKQIAAIQHHTVKNEVVKLNSIILGVHNYYSMATMCNIDSHRVYFLVKINHLEWKSEVKANQQAPLGGGCECGAVGRPSVRLSGVVVVVILLKMQGYSTKESASLVGL